jgi:hypothetical protein
MTDQTQPGTDVTVHQPQQHAVSTDTGGAFTSAAAFDRVQRMARLLAASTMVPQQYQQNLPNCVIALEVASRVGGNVLAVMQGLNVIHGRPAWSAQYVAGAIAASGLFSALDFEWSGAPSGPVTGTTIPDAWACRAWAYDLRSREKKFGPWVSVAMAKADGWFNRQNSKWPTMPEIMLANRAITFFGKRYASHILNGMDAADEVLDAVPPGAAPAPVQLVQTVEIPATADPAQITAAATAATSRRRNRAVQEPVPGDTPPPPQQAPAQAPAADTPAPTQPEPVSAAPAAAGEGDDGLF